MNPEEKRKVIIDLMTPFKKAFDSSKTWEPTMRLADFLIEHGDCPSVVRAKTIGLDIGSFRSLSKMILFDHSVRVARIAVEEIGPKTYADSLVPSAIISSLGHDIGKADVLRPFPYRKEDHPPAAAEEMKKIFKDHVPWLSRLVLPAILEHHGIPTSSLSEALKRADGRAREQEMELLSGGQITRRDWSEWFNERELLHILAKVVNIVYTERNLYCPAVSFRGVVYVRPDELTIAAQRLAAHNNVIDSELHREEKDDAVASRIVGLLAKKDLLAARMNEQHYFKQYSLLFSNGRPLSGLFVPIRLTAFGVKAYTFERRKEGPLKYLCDVRPESAKIREM